MAEPPEYSGDADDLLLEPIKISNEVLIELLKNTEQPSSLNVRMFRLIAAVGLQSAATYLFRQFAT